METTKPKFALVTGASKGLGKSIAIQLAVRNINLLLVSMENEGLAELSQDISENYGVIVHHFEVDLVEENSIERIADWIQDMEITILINNAGIGGTQKFENAGFDYLDSMIKINIRSLTLLTFLLLPKLKKHSRSFILNVASMASFSPIAYKTIYPASKAFVHSFSLCLNEELRDTGVFVGVLNPGPMPTNKNITSRIQSQSKYVKLGILSPDVVAKIAIKNLFENKTVTIPGIFNQLNWILMKLVPTRIKVPLISNSVRRELNEEVNIMTSSTLYSENKKSIISEKLQTLQISVPD